MPLAAATPMPQNRAGLLEGVGLGEVTEAVAVPAVMRADTVVVELPEPMLNAAPDG